MEYKLHPKNISIDCVDFDVRSYNALRRGGVEKLGDINSTEQIMKFRNIGAKTIVNIVDKLKEYGIEIN